MNNFWNGFEKRARLNENPDLVDAAEIAGLGTLAVPSIQHWRERAHMPAHARPTLGQHLGAHKYELAGLGILAAPSVYKAGRWAWNKMKGQQPTTAVQ